MCLELASFDPLFGRIEKEGDLGGLLGGIIVCWPWDILFLIARDSTPCWVLGDIASLGDGRLREAIRNNERLLVVLAGARYDL